MAEGLLLLPKDARRLAAVLRHFEQNGERLHRFRRNPIITPDATWFWAIITGFVAIGANRWGYAFSAVQIDETKAVVVNPDGPTETIEGNYAINMIEANNAIDGVQGHSVNVSGADYPGGFEVQPVGGRMSFDSSSPDYNVIGKQVPVQMWPTTDTAGGTVYVFVYENSDDGTCS